MSPYLYKKIFNICIFNLWYLLDKNTEKIIDFFWVRRWNTLLNFIKSILLLPLNSFTGCAAACYSYKVDCREVSEQLERGPLKPGTHKPATQNNQRDLTVEPRGISFLKSGLRDYSYRVYKKRHFLVCKAFLIEY